MWTFENPSKGLKTSIKKKVLARNSGINRITEIKEMKRILASRNSDADTSFNGQLKKKMRRDDSEDSDSSDDEETDPYVLGFSGLLQKYSSAYARGGGDGSRC